MDDSRSACGGVTTPHPQGSAGRRRLRGVLLLAYGGLGLLSLAIIAAVGLFLYLQFRLAQSWEQAQQACDEHDWAAARAHLEEYLHYWPDSKEAHFLLARVCRRVGDSEAAREHLDQAQRLHSDPEALRLERLLLDVQAGLLVIRPETLDKYLDVGDGQDKLVLEALILGALQRNSLGDAFHYCRLWEERHPDDWLLFYWRGQMFEQWMQQAKAAAQYRQVLAKKPAFAPARLRLGRVLLHLGEYPTALAHFQQYLESDPDHPEALLGLARCQRSASAPEEARATLEKLLARHPDHASGLLLRGQLALDAGQPQAALDWLKRAEAVSPKGIALYEALASALRHARRDEEAQKYQAEVRQIYKDLKKVEDTIKEIAERKPTDVDLRCEVGRIHLRLGYYERAIQWLVSGLMLEPGHQPSREALAEVLPKLGNPHLTERYLRVLKN